MKVRFVRKLDWHLAARAIEERCWRLAGGGWHADTIRGDAYRGSERLGEHREGVWLGQLRVCRAWMRPLMEISDEARLRSG